MLETGKTRASEFLTAGLQRHITSEFLARPLALGLGFVCLSMEPPPLDSRIRYSGSNGTVRYVGPVDNTQGIWLGVEWDDPERGKHDGSKDGRRYFSCRYDIVGHPVSFRKAKRSLDFRVQDPSFGHLLACNVEYPFCAPYRKSISSSFTVSNPRKRSFWARRKGQSRSKPSGSTRSEVDCLAWSV